jgi:hypothetical protein
MKKTLIAAALAAATVPAIASAQFSLEINPENGDVTLFNTEPFSAMDIISTSGVLLPDNLPVLGGPPRLGQIDFSEGGFLSIFGPADVDGQNEFRIALANLGVPASPPDGDFLFPSLVDVSAIPDSNSNGLLDNDDLAVEFEFTANTADNVTLTGLPVTLVPEPASLGLVAAAGLGLIRRRSA